MDTTGSQARRQAPAFSADGTCAYAHSSNGRRRHGLVEHLEGTARLAEEFGRWFGQPQACRAAGLWHDVGKVSAEFQRYLAACETPVHPPHGPDHKAAGAVVVAGRRDTAPVAPLILGHHGGIPDFGEAQPLLAAARLRRDVVEAQAWATSVFSPIAPLPALPGSTPERDILLRLIFSSLVDADFLDTEEHFDAARAAVRTTGHASSSLNELQRVEESAHAVFLAAHRSSSRIDAIRADIRDRALEAALLPPGLFRLTVPTGGGKTRTGLAFALRHAVAHGLRRVVVAIPFLTITDQTASVYRGIVGARAVLEHHSAVDQRRAEAGPQARLYARLAAENWDGPVIVTTTVQLFESLFSNRPSALRKGHRLARSVIILDEAQALPLRVLGVTMDALAALARCAGATIVFSTATQPALEHVGASLPGELREIVPTFEEHFTALRRVSFSVPAREKEAWSWDQVATAARGAAQSLVIVNRRRHAVTLPGLIGPDTHHLSTLLCGAHRRDVLRTVRRALAEGEPCRLVATQVVEAGVDIDFPLVLRALAPLDSIIQAAGRCNREGRRETGRCIVFRIDERDTDGDYRTGADIVSGMLAQGDLDFNDPATCAAYFRQLYGQGSLLRSRVDPRGLRKLVAECRFRTLAETYHLIEDITRPVVVLYPPVYRRIERLLAAMERALDPASSRRLTRLLQPYVVSLRPRDIEHGRLLGLIRERAGLQVWTGPYDMRVGVGNALVATSRSTAEQPAPPSISSSDLVI